MTVHSANLTNRRASLSKANAMLVSRGWDALVNTLGYADATRFIMLIDKGSGDSVKFFRDLWGETNAQDIYKKIIAERGKSNKK